MADVRETTSERAPLVKNVKEDTSAAAVEMQGQEIRIYKFDKFKNSHIPYLQC